MARSRNIKPGFFKNETLAECSSLARLLFAGLWCLADRAGRLEDRPKRIRAEVLPYDDGSVDEMLEELRRAGFIKRYQVGDQRLIQVQNFAKHQNPHCREPESTIPAPDEHSTSTVLEQYEHRTGPADSLNLIPDSLLLDSDAGASVVASKLLAPCPHKEILGLYAQELPDLAQPRVWDGAREKNLRARWAWVLADLKKKGKPFDKEAGLVFFQRMFGYIAGSDLLMGRSGKWATSLPWIVEAENFAKIIEGNYENKVAA